MSLTLLLATISTICIIISGIVIAFGWVAIRKGNEEKHKKLMVTGAVFALTFFIFYMTRTTFLGNVPYAGPEAYALTYHIFLIIHIILSTTGGILGLISLYLGFKGKYNAHRKIGPYTSVIWFITAITGVAVYVILFVLWPSEAETGLLKAIFGI